MQKSRMHSSCRCPVTVLSLRIFKDSANLILIVEMSQPSNTPEQPQIEKEMVMKALQEILNEVPAFKALLAMKPAKSTAVSDPPDDSESSPHGSGNGGLAQSLNTGILFVMVCGFE